VGGGFNEKKKKVSTTAFSQLQNFLPVREEINYTQLRIYGIVLVVGNKSKKEYSRYGQNARIILSVVGDLTGSGFKPHTSRNIVTDVLPHAPRVK